VEELVGLHLDRINANTPATRVAVCSRSYYSPLTNNSEDLGTDRINVNAPATRVAVLSPPTH
jgi:hypothetical protein